MSPEECETLSLIRHDHDDSFDSEEHASCHAGARLATRPFLAARYRVRFAITPFETPSEFAHFQNRMRELRTDKDGRVNGGRKLDILAETRRWNSFIANGLDTFYKVPYYFESQLKGWLHSFHQNESLRGFQASAASQSVPTALPSDLHPLSMTPPAVQQQSPAPTPASRLVPPDPLQHPVAAPLSLAPPPQPQTQVRIRSSTSKQVIRGATALAIRPEKLRSRRECQVCCYRAPPEPARNCKGTGKRSSCEKLGWYNGDFFCKWGAWPEGCNISLAARAAIEAGVRSRGG